MPKVWEMAKIWPHSLEDGHPMDGTCVYMAVGMLGSFVYYTGRCFEVYFLTAVFSFTQTVAMYKQL